MSRHSMLVPYQPVSSLQRCNMREPWASERVVWCMSVIQTGIRSILTQRRPLGWKRGGGGAALIRGGVRISRQ